MLVTCTTVTDWVALKPPKVAVIVVVPLPTAVTKPLELIVKRTGVAGSQDRPTKGQQVDIGQAGEITGDGRLLDTALRLKIGDGRRRSPGARL